MSYTKDLFDVIDEFMKTRSDAREKYLLLERSYANKRGTAIYDETMNEARDNRAGEIAEAQKAARTKVQEILAAMRENAKKAHHMTPPTADQMNILQLMQMKDHLTADELDSAAASIGGNSYALSLLGEIAVKHGIYTSHMHYAQKGLSPAQAIQAVGDLAKHCRDIIDNTTGVSRAAALYADQRRMRYNDQIDPDTLPQEERYKDMLDFYEPMRVSYNALSQAVD